MNHGTGLGFSDHIRNLELEGISAFTGTNSDLFVTFVFVTFVFVASGIERQDWTGGLWLRY